MHSLRCNTDHNPMHPRLRWCVDFLCEGLIRELEERRKRREKVEVCGVQGATLIVFVNLLPWCQVSYQLSAAAVRSRRASVGWTWLTVCAHTPRRLKELGAPCCTHVYAKAQQHTRKLCRKPQQRHERKWLRRLASEWQEATLCVFCGSLFSPSKPLRKSAPRSRPVL